MKSLPQTLFTETIDGPVPHLSLPYAGGTFLAPAKLQLVPRPPDLRRNSSSGWKIWMSGDQARGLQLPKAEKLGDQFVFALPGGGETYA